ncbi:hypothetical protein NQ314_005745 [Rhamnusium bicolor]|uniref:Uncharacterized protein n=1 Tax=Rhamnusium bicolor TaxID=1586634 RepID=A0AAV8ZDW7_9CUCU|nr:hypothetical protein NQ314_005745 [Rhamnusium bicolor]
MDIEASDIFVISTKTFRAKEKRQAKKIVQESSERSKQRRVKPIVSDLSSEKLCLAAESSLVKSGKGTAAQVVKLAIQSTPNRLKKMKLVHNTSSSATIRPYSPEEDVIETRHKDYKKLRQYNSRKTSRINTNIVLSMPRLPTFYGDDDEGNGDQESDDDDMDDEDLDVE